ncbi:trypsin-like peptidase domain-containing protein [Candidatus Falkowbacteria bacterium]|nr:trypsin-like peptidase domain-containing protein [Candidatus Falkowbacteria bacterium]
MTSIFQGERAIIRIVLMASIILAGLGWQTAAQAQVASTTAASSTSPANFAQVESKAYAATVKIKVFNLNEDFAMTEIGSGSGFFINSTGLVLTNYHVVTNEDESSGIDLSDQPLGYQVCVTKQTNLEPECNYTASVVAKDRDLDVALLQVKPTPKMSEITSFPYLEINSSDQTSINDTVIAVGYPGIGSETITITKGIVSGKTSKYDRQWLKTDAMISFGNSGGAAIDSAGRVVGITTQTYSDFVGSIGYIMSTASFYGWLQSHQNDKPKDNPLSQRAGDFAWKSKILLSSNKYISLDPPFEFSKPKDWKFFYNGEDDVMVRKEKDQDGGAVRVVWTRLPFVPSIADLSIIAKQRLDTDLLDVNSIKEADVKRGKTVIGRKFTVNSRSYQGNSTSNTYLFAASNYVVTVDYNYGKNNKDKAVVDSIINSFNLRGGAKPFRPLASYDHRFAGVPRLIMKAGGDWQLHVLNSKDQPIQFFNKKNKLYSGEISLRKINPEEEDISLAALTENSKKELEDVVQMLKVRSDIQLISEVKGNFKFSKGLSGMVRRKMILYNKKSSLKYYVGTVEYIKPIGSEYVMTASLNIVETDKKKIDKMIIDFEKMLSGLAIK